jgi:hypothetical protein
VVVWLSRSAFAVSRTGARAENAAQSICRDGRKAIPPGGRGADRAICVRSRTTSRAPWRGPCVMGGAEGEY